MRPIFEHEPFDFPELEADTLPDGHRYYHVGVNLRYPSVTTVLQSLPKPQLESWRQRVGVSEANKVTKQAASKGTGIHKIAERYLLNDPDHLKGQMPTAVESFNKIKPAIDAHVTKVHNNEFCLWSSRLMTAGRSDLLAEWDGEKAIIDFKGSNKPKKLEWIEGYIIQTCTYAMMVKERIGLIVPKIVILVAVPSLVEPQIFIQDVGDNYMKVWNVFKNYHAGLNAT